MDIRVGKRTRIRIVPPPQASFKALAEHAPGAEAMAQRAAERVAQRLRPLLSWFFGARRRMATIGVGVLTVWFFVHVMFGPNGMIVYRQKKAEYQTLEKDVDNLQEENDRYSAQIKSLKTDPKTIEREAREQLHYARPGEVVYVSPAPVNPQPPVTNSAHK